VRELPVTAEQNESRIPARAPPLWPVDAGRGTCDQHLPALEINEGSIPW